MAKVDTQAQTLTDEQMGSGFFGSTTDTSIDLTPEEIAIRDETSAPVVEPVAEPELEPVIEPVIEVAIETGAPVEPAKEKSHMVPISRLNDQIIKTRNLERQLENYQNPLTPAVKAEDIPPLDVKIDQEEFSRMSDALLDGKADIALPLFSKMIADAVKVGVAHGKADTLATVQKDLDKRISRGVDNTLVADQYEAAIDATYEAYPIFNPESADFDADMMADAKALQASYQVTHGMVKGHNMAVERALKLHHPELLVKTPEVTSTEAPAGAARNPDQIRKNAAAAAAQPARPAGRAAAPAEVTPMSVDNLTDEEFDALPESKKAVLRGD